MRGCGFRISGAGCRVDGSGFGFRVSSLGVSNFGSRVSGCRFGAEHLVFRVPGSGFRVSGLRVSSFGTVRATPPGRRTYASRCPKPYLDLQIRGRTAPPEPRPLQVMSLTTHPGGHPTCRGTSIIRSRPPWDPTEGLCLGLYGAPRGGGVSYERGTPVVHCQPAFLPQVNPQ